MWLLILILSIPSIWIIYSVIRGSAVERGFIEDIKDLKPPSKKNIINAEGELETVEKTGSEKTKDWSKVILMIIGFVLFLVVFYFLALVGGWDVSNF